jgi:hypothetical protein
LLSRTTVTVIFSVSETKTDGQRIVTGSYDRGKMWEAATPLHVVAWQEEEDAALARW